MRFTLPIILLLLVSAGTHAQCAQENLRIRDDSMIGAIRHYLDSVKNYATLYHGEPTTTSYSTVKHPFLIDNRWQKADLTFDDVFYPGVEVKYDLVDDLLIINADDRHAIILDKERVSRFELGDRVFVSLSTETMKNSFYELRVCGEVSFLIKKEKKVYEIRDYPIVRTEYQESDKYYLMKDDLLFKIKGKNSILNFFKEDQKNIKHFIRQSGLSFYQDPEGSIGKTVDFYNTSIAIK